MGGINEYIEYDTVFDRNIYAYNWHSFLDKKSN